MSVGAVSVDGNSTSVVGDNLYLYQDLTGQALSSPIEWDVTGGNGFDAFTIEATSSFPSVSEISSEKVNTAQDFTLELDGIVSGADSAFIIVVGANKDFKMTVPTGRVSYLIPASDLSDLGATEFGTVLISAYNFSSQDVDGKTIYFVNQSTVSKIVEVE